MLFLLGCVADPDTSNTSTPPELDVVGLTVTDTAAPPGVLLIMLDDLGFGDTSISAFADVIAQHQPGWKPDISTPSLEAFSTQGLSLTSFRVDAPVCAPTRAAVMTGLQPHTAGLWSANSNLFSAQNQLGLRPGLVLLPELLSEAGFATSMVGKWHLGEHGIPWDPAGGDGDCLAADTPDTRGFDRFFGFLNAIHEYRINDDCGALVTSNEDQGLLPVADCPYTDEHTTELFTDQALSELAVLEESGDPWFLYVAYNAPHSPVTNGSDWIRDAAEADPDSDYAAMVASCLAPENRELNQGGDDYCLLVTHLDAHLGRLLAAAPEDALVIVMSDNGGEEAFGASNDPFRGTKGNLFNGGTVVPMLVRGPQIPADMALDVGMTSADLFPTVLEFAGVPAPQTQQVTDFPADCDTTLEPESVPVVSDSRLSVLQDGEMGCRAEIFQENAGQAALIWQNEETGESWKMMTELRYHTPGTDETTPRCEPLWNLYEVTSDPLEADNLVSVLPDRTEEMTAALKKRISGLPHNHADIAWHTCCFANGEQDCEAACGDCQ